MWCVLVVWLDNSSLQSCLKDLLIFRINYIETWFLGSPLLYLRTKIMKIYKSDIFVSSYFKYLENRILSVFFLITGWWSNSFTLPLTNYPYIASSHSTFSFLFGPCICTFLTSRLLPSFSLGHLPHASNVNPSPLLHPCGSQPYFP